MFSRFRSYQLEADNAIYNRLFIDGEKKCLVKMFCGTGKSLVMRCCKAVEDKELLVYVFPSLQLVNQSNKLYLSECNVLCVSSENDSTTDVNEITKFLSKTHKNKIICVTYQSFETLLSCLEQLNIKINICVFDEAHHAVGEKYQTLIFDNDVCEKQIFFTATPKNANGIVMYDEDKPELSICGPLAYDYSYFSGMTDGYLNPFEVRVDMYLENTNKSVYESIARAILESGNTRVLTFHSDVNTDRDTSVKNFVDEKLFIATFKSVMKTEFPKIKASSYKSVRMIELHAGISGTERDKILARLDTTDNSLVTVISSCGTIGEGTDTKNANMCVFVDPKSSFVQIVQNIGRVVRPQSKISTILIPCWVDKEKYLDCNGNKEKCDEVIRQDMSEGGNFNGILNVMSALKQEDPEIYNICLYYPDTFSPKEIEANLEKQGYEIGEGGELVEVLSDLLDEELDYDDYEDCDNDEEIIMRVAEENDVRIEVHSNSLENPVSVSNPGATNVVRMYVEETEDGQQEYCPIVHKESGSKKRSDKVSPPSRENRNKFSVHTNPDIKVLWNVVGGDLTKEISSCVIDCEVVDKWYENFERLKKFINDNKKKPNSESKEDENEKKLGNWWQRQQSLYKKKEQGMKNEERYKLWTKFLEEYKEYFISDDEIWYDKFNYLKEFIDKNKRRPNKESSKKLGEWLGMQIRYYMTNSGGMKIKERYDLWSEFLEEYKEYFVSVDNKWQNKFNELKEFINKYKVLPKQKSTNIDENKSATWLSQQQNNYKKKQRSMNNKLHYELWSKFLEEYKEYFISDDEIWFKKFDDLKQFIDKNKNRPSQDSKNLDEKKLGQWLSQQQNNYKKKEQGMKNKERYNLWKKFSEEYKEYLISDDEKWFKRFNDLKEFINKNKYIPSQKSENESEKKIGVWYTSQTGHYKKKTSIMKIEERYNLWKQFLEEYKEYIVSFDNKWITNLESLISFIKINDRLPKQRAKDKQERSIGLWFIRQNKNYKNKIESMKDINKYNMWSEFLEDYKEYFCDTEIKYITSDISQTSKKCFINEEDEGEITLTLKKKTNNLNLSKKEKTNDNNERKPKPLATISELHKKYVSKNPQDTHKEFEDSPQLWDEYHDILEESEKTLEYIPRNKIIDHMSLIKTKRTKSVVDMGCGRAKISKHFANDNRFHFINYDHIASDNSITKCDISSVPLENDIVEICILSLAMWGLEQRSSKYVEEAHRILETGGILYIVETTKRWTEKDTDGNFVGEPGNKLLALLEANNFKVLERNIDKFCMFICMK